MLDINVKGATTLLILVLLILVYFSGMRNSYSYIFILFKRLLIWFKIHS